ncbi:MAG: ImmA/IrrE family metallo-endopeptidase [Proteobacteria bacterium]|nr:ImmA/IrrE family metallo-endopeptidase [Pseudomonadota bacterium]MCG2745712.1 ImmA/IrrE family metallo-endopeptidase [Desulfobacteraceae bacterium]MBU3983947.1 ImmA/IrrE family metallo-endopeptidase [Pseudomonadota bacterium]MBU4041577.1 ImmA/IrrE family metallo-endopeptidase [Pseudomonadota bacterium]MBU4108391.1 ImmA/IrrE family metallo-endopeptidase [Pseudomonadota bacterium]
MSSEENNDKHAQNRLLHFEDCAHAIDQLFLSALGNQGPSAFGEFLGFARQFNNLSVYNAMLVRIQRPGAGAVGSRRQWREIDRHVLPDAIPIVILQPFGPVRFIFEHGDTEGRPMPAQDKNPLFAEGKVGEQLYQRTKKAADNFSVEVVETDHYGNNLAGTAAGLSVCPEKLQSKSARAFRIKLNSRHDLPSRYATLAHELGHIYCGHLGQDAKGRWPDRRGLFPSLEAMELEAEAVAWLVCQRNGITTRSEEYLNQLIDEAGLQTVSMYAIYEAANRVESRTEPKKT